MLDYGPEPGTSQQELDALLHGYSDQQLRDQRNAAEPGTVWRTQLDDEARRRGWVSTHVVPATNWSDALAEILHKAQPGDTITVSSEAVRRGALGAAERMGREGLTIEVAKSEH